MQFFAGMLVGQRGGVVCVEVDENARVGTLRRAFIDEVNRDDKEKRIQCAADNVELFLAQVDESWLPSRDDRVQQLTIGEIPEDIQDILSGYPLDPTSSVRDICNGSTPEKTIQILIVAPPRSVENVIIGTKRQVEHEIVIPRNRTRSVTAPTSLFTSDSTISTQPVDQVARAESSTTVDSSLTSEPMEEDDSGVEIIDNDTRDHLRQLAASLPRSNGKWAKVLQEYAKRNPKTKLTPENLRCRLKVKKPHVRRDVPNQPAVTKEGKKRKRLLVACQSCHKAKVRCGADSKNQDCEYRDIALSRADEI